MKKYLLSIFAIAISCVLPMSASARGVIALTPTASIKIGGQSSQTVLTGQNIPNIVWRGKNGKTFQTRLMVNNSALCGGITDNQVWSQGRTASGSFDLGVAPKAREGCVLTFVYEVTNAIGNKAIDRAVIRYIAPAKTPPIVAKNTLLPLTTVNNPRNLITTTPTPTLATVSPKSEKVVVKSPIKGNIISAGGKVVVEWTAENIGSDKEFVIYLEGAYGDKVDNLSTRVDASDRSLGLWLPYNYTPGLYRVVVAVNSKGVDTLKNAKLFKSEIFTITNGSVVVKPSSVPVKIETKVNRGTNGDAFLYLYRKGFKTNNLIDNWKLDISCDSGIYIYGKDGETSLCSETFTYLASDHYNVFEDYLALTTGIQNENSKSAKIRFTLTGYDASNNVLGVDKKNISVKGKR